ncbi:MAG: hypothetical protein AB1351_07805 [Thermoproteota archaeon]
MKRKIFGKITISNHLTATIIAIMIISTSFLSVMPQAFATTEEEMEFTLRTTQQVYVPGETLEIFGRAEPNQVLVIRLYDPAGLAIRIEDVEVDEEGLYRSSIFMWPAPSRNLVFGTYTIEVLSALGNVEPLRAEVAFAGGFDQGLDPTRGHVLGVKLDTPSQVAVNVPFRIFAQITFDGALVEAVDDQAVIDILGTSHIHSSNSTINLSGMFRELHPGLYYADIQLPSEDTYVVHVAAFYRGFLSHDTRLIAASASSIGTIQDSVDLLNTQLDSTNQELERLRQGLDETRSALNDTKSTITNSVDNAQASIRGEIDAVQQASGQINAVILPVLALISVIIALQISLFARIRASYR